MLIKNVDLDGTLCDLRLEGNRISAIGRFDSPSDARLVRDGPLGDGPERGDLVFDGQGGAILPGLHDHHIHINALAAARLSVACGPPHVTSQPALIEALRRARATAPETGLRGTGYHESVAGTIDRAFLDRHGPEIPIRIQHRSGRLWIMNSKMMAYYGLKAPDNGRFFDFDAALRHRTVEKIPFPDITPTVSYLLSRGITGVTEVTPSNEMAEFEHYRKALMPLRHVIMGRASLTGLRDRARGPLKLHYHEADLPSLEGLVAEIKAAHRAGRHIASHCVTRAELMLTLAAVEEAGPLPGDRIEHAAVADAACIDWIKRLGMTVVTQPHFIHGRAAAYKADVSKQEQPDLWRLRSFAAAGLPLAAGSDAPFGDPDPWAVMAAATTRPAGFDADEAITPEAALDLYTKPAADAGSPPRRLEVGCIADLCLLTQPWAQARGALDAVTIAMTAIDGRCVFKAG